MNYIIEESMKIDFLTISGTFSKKIDLRMLTYFFTIDDKITSFIGLGLNNFILNKEHFYKENKYFTNRCVFFNNKKSINIYEKTFTIVGFKNIDESKEFLTHILNKYINNTYLIEENNEEYYILYLNKEIFIEEFKMNLIHYSFKLNDNFTFCRYLLVNLEDIISEEDKRNIKIGIIKPTFSSISITIEFLNKNIFEINFSNEYFIITSPIYFNNLDEIKNHEIFIFIIKYIDKIINKKMITYYNKLNFLKEIVNNR